MNQISFFSMNNTYLLEAKGFQGKSVIIAHITKQLNGHKIPIAIQMETFRNGTSKFTAQIEKV